MGARRGRASAAPWRTLLACVAAVGTASGCAASGDAEDGGRRVGRPASSPAQWRLPSAFPQILNADADGDAHGIWVAVEGRADASAPAGVRVFGRRGLGGGWRAAPTPPVEAGDDGHVEIAATASGPCLGLQSTRGDVDVRCLRDGRWRRWPLPAGFAATTFNQLLTADGRLHLLVRTPRETFAVLSAERPLAPWTLTGDEIASGSAIARLGPPSAPGRAPRLVTEDVGKPPSLRRVWTLDATARRWTSSEPLRSAALGPQTSGPVGAVDASCVAVSEATPRAPWSVRIARVDASGRWTRSAPLNRGAGSAQGGLFHVGATSWAIWQQHEPKGPNRFEDRVYARPVRCDAGRPVLGRTRTLYDGVSIGPGSLEVVGGLGGTWALLMRPTSARQPFGPVLERLG
jgi:hypothetical protein